MAPKRGQDDYPKKLKAWLRKVNTWQKNVHKEIVKLRKAAGMPKPPGGVRPPPPPP